MGYPEGCWHRGSEWHDDRDCPSRDRALADREAAEREARRRQFEDIVCPVCHTKGHGRGPCPNINEL